MAYPQYFYNTARRAHRDSLILGTSNEFDVGSTVQLAPPPARGVAVRGDRSSMTWAPYPATATTTPLSVGHYEHGQPRKETWATSVLKGLKAVGTDGAAAVVSTLAMCFFIGIAMWALLAVQDQWEGNGLDAADDAEAGVHLDAYSAPPSSPVAGIHEKIPKIDWKITVGTRRPRSSKPSWMSTTELPDVAVTSPAIRSNEDNADSRAADGAGYDSIERSKAPGISANEDAVVAAGSRRVHVKRGLPSKGHRSTRRRSVKRVNRRRRVPQRTVPRQDQKEEVSTVPATEKTP
ncbi:hypothetical protein HPB50_004164 [Hyalomma asiaticum]|uniref:Uncharacterized protein n=1 Tax=Hyalomma asiaticum TaxID=266040 RepID=A0ACB7SRM7_HYAAI|nr:hypothetical protein HPB50_004164 [Hyalomma asiaticum]